MSDQEFENYLALVGRMLRLSRRQANDLGCELRDHVEQRVDELVEAGNSPKDALRTALEEFGDAASLAAQFSAVQHLVRRRWMMRFATLSMAGSFLVAVLAMAMWPSDARFGSPGHSVAQDQSTPTEVADQGPSVSDNNRATAVRLNRAINVDFFEQPFDDFVEELKDLIGVSIWIHPSARDLGLDGSQLVTMQFSECRASTLLEMVLSQHDCTYAIKDGIVVILSEDTSCEQTFLQVRVFDCQGLSERLAATVDQPGDTLVQLITEIVLPESWEQNGGVGKIRELNGSLVVYQNTLALGAIDQILNDLRRVHSLPSP